jgi:hypothetical protein
VGYLLSIKQFFRQISANFKGDLGTHTTTSLSYIQILKEINKGFVNLYTLEMPSLQLHSPLSLIQLLKIILGSHSHSHPACLSSWNYKQLAGNTHGYMQSCTTQDSYCPLQARDNPPVPSLAESVWGYHSPCKCRVLADNTRSCKRSCTTRYNFLTCQEPRSLRCMSRLWGLRCLNLSFGWASWM